MSSKLKILNFLFLFCFANLGHAQSIDMQSSTLVPIEWQAIKLQENIEAKINRSLKPIIKDSDYVIEVKIDVDMDSQEDPSSKKITKSQQRKKIRFSKTEFPEDGDDYVVFNKIGLEAPIIGEDEVETETSDVELAQKAIIEMNDRFNLFKFLKGININLTFDKEISEKSRINIKY